MALALLVVGLSLALVGHLRMTVETSAPMTHHAADPSATHLITATPGHEAADVRENGGYAGGDERAHSMLALCLGVLAATMWVLRRPARVAPIGSARDHARSVSCIRRRRPAPILPSRVDVGLVLLV